MNDQVEKSLRDIAERLQTAWRNNQCTTCPLGELAALAMATWVFYREQHKPKELDHWSNYRGR
mgnify:FL=1